MSEKRIVVGHFAYHDDALKAARELRKWGAEFDLYSPFPSHGLEEEVFSGKPRSPVRFFTLLGGLLGCLGGFAMTIFMSMDYPLRTSAKPVISIPAFVVIAFECTILLGAIFTLLSMLHFSRIPNLGRWPGYRAEFSRGTFGISVRAALADSENFKEILAKAGAQQVEVHDE